MCPKKNLFWNKKNFDVLLSKISMLKKYTVFYKKITLIKLKYRKND